MTRDEAIELKQSLLWKTFTEELDKLVTMDIEKLIHDKNPEGILRAQERINALRQCIRMPDIIAEREE